VTPLLVQVNVARMRAPLDDPVMAGFVAGLAAVHRLAEGSPGFGWRLGTGHCVLTDDAGPAVVNVSAWVCYADLHAFVYRSAHGRYVRRRAEWFLPTEQPSTALWWCRPDGLPDLAGAVRRLQYLRRYGPTPRAFSLRMRFGADGRPER
jgi:Domain of unknown function (DUF3291)